MLKEILCVTQVPPDVRIVKVPADQSELPANQHHYQDGEEGSSCPEPAAEARTEVQRVFCNSQRLFCWVTGRRKLTNVMHTGSVKHQCNWTSTFRARFSGRDLTESRYTSLKDVCKSLHLPTVRRLSKWLMEERFLRIFWAIVLPYSIFCIILSP